MTKEERIFFDSMVSGIREFQERRKGIFEGRREEMETVAFLEPIPQFVGADMKNYGPFERGDMATVPKDNAALLIEKNIAKLINPNR